MRLRLAIVVSLLALIAPASASAHAQLESSSPARGAVVAREPSQVTFRFDEPVEGNFGAVRVYDAGGGRVDRGDAFHPGGDGTQLSVHLRPRLARGTYTATYRVVSADGHIVSSGVIFSIGKAGAVGATVDQLLARDRTGSGPVSDIAFAIARGVSYGATAIAVGGLLFLLACWLPAQRAIGDNGERLRLATSAYRSRLRLLLFGAALAGAIATLAGVVLEAAGAAGVSGWTALRPHIMREVLDTRFGTVWAISAGCWLAFGVLASLLLAPRRHTQQPLPGIERWIVAPPLAFLLLAPALAGHGATQHPRGVLFPSIVVHVAAMSAWVGGIAALLVCMPAATRHLERAARTRLLSAVTLRFSALALVAVAVLLASGLVQSFFEIRHLSLVFTTAFGRAVFIKLVLLLTLIGLGALNRRHTIPRIAVAARSSAAPGAAGLLLRRTLRVEAGLIVAALGTTAALASYAPAVAANSGPANVSARIGPAELQMTVDPSQTGANAIHIYLTDPRTGAQFTHYRQLTVTATLPSKAIGPLPLQTTPSGPGHVTIGDAFLTAPGTWTISIAVRTSEFDEFSRDLEVKVR